MEEQASIGFAIPVTDMFKGDIIWRGIVYTILMLFAKLVTGIWLIRINLPWSKFKVPTPLHSLLARSAACIGWPKIKGTRKGNSKAIEAEGPENIQESSKHEDCTVPPDPLDSASPPRDSPPSSNPISPLKHPKMSKPLSLYPAAMLGTAMTARGEIGFLISSLAETTGVFAASNKKTSGSSEIYLVVTWAIVLCTIIGPLGIGTLVKRVRRLQEERRECKSNRADPLGIWGVG